MLVQPSPALNSVTAALYMNICSRLVHNVVHFIDIYSIKQQHYLRVDNFKASRDCSLVFCSFSSKHKRHQKNHCINVSNNLKGSK